MLIKDKEEAIRAVEQNVDVLDYVHNNLLSDKEFMLFAIQKASLHSKAPVGV